MAKSTIRQVVDQALADNNLHLGGSVFTNCSGAGLRVKYTRHRVLSTNLMHFILQRLGMDEECGQYKYRYVTLTSPQQGGYHGMAVGCTNDLSVLRRVCNTGPTMYTYAGLYYDQAGVPLTLGDMNNNCFNWGVGINGDNEFNLELLTNECYEKREAARRASYDKMMAEHEAEDAAEKQKLQEQIDRTRAEQKIKDDLYEAYKAAQVKRADMIYARDQAAHVFSTDVLDQMEYELGELCQAWDAIGFSLVQIK